MIYSLQKRFIRITAFSIAFVFALIFLLISLISSFQTNGMMDSIADLLSQNGGRFPDRREAPGEPPHTPDDMFFSPETQFSIRFFLLYGQTKTARSPGRIQSRSLLSQRRKYRTTQTECLTAGKNGAG